MMGTYRFDSADYVVTVQADSAVDALDNVNAIFKNAFISAVKGILLHEGTGTDCVIRGFMWMDLKQEIKDCNAVMYATGTKYYRCLYHRWTFINYYREIGAERRNDAETFAMPSTKAGLLKAVAKLIGTGVDSISIGVGLNGADSPNDYQNGVYDPWVEEGEVQIFDRELYRKILFKHE